MVTDEITIDTRFGTFPARAEDVLTVPDGLPGFEACRRYVVVTSAALEPFTCLQGLEGTRPSFLALDPRLVVADYAAPLHAAARRRLDAQVDDPLLWLALVHLGEAAGSVNLRAPVVINPRRMLGVQLMGDDSRYTTDHRLLLD